MCRLMVGDAGREKGGNEGSALITRLADDECEIVLVNISREISEQFCEKSDGKRGVMAHDRMGDGQFSIAFNYPIDGGYPDPF
jgi:hypothetical protein